MCFVAYKNGPPKEDNVNKLFNLHFDIVEDELLRDLFTRLPTQTNNNNNFYLLTATGFVNRRSPYGRLCR
jgi:hypothetical protein